MVCRTARQGVPSLLCGPQAAGVVARLIGARLSANGDNLAAAMIDTAVYAARRPLRMLGSTKLADVRSRPLAPLDGARR